MSILTQGEISFGYKPDLPPALRAWSPKADWDFKDLKGNLKVAGTGNTHVLPLKYIFVRNQNPYPTCVGHGTWAALKFQLAYVLGKDFNPSALMLWYNACKFSGTLPNVEGTYINAALYALGHNGFCSEDKDRYLKQTPGGIWIPKDETEMVVRPELEALQDADDNKLEEFEYRRVSPDPDDIEASIRANIGVITGKAVGSSYINQFDNPDEETVLTDMGPYAGRHCTYYIGVRQVYRGGQLKREFLDFNSWGPWGHGAVGSDGESIPYGCRWISEDLAASGEDNWAVTISKQHFIV